MSKPIICIVDKALPKNEGFYDQLIVETEKHGLSVTYCKELEEDPKYDAYVLAAPTAIPQLGPDETVLGLRTLNRKDRLIIAEQVVSADLMARWAAPGSEEELSSVLASWGKNEYIFKYDWSAGRRGVRLFSPDKDQLPEDYDPDRDVVMEHLNEDSYTYKADLCCGVLMNAWFLRTAGIASGEFYAHTKKPSQYELPEAVKLQLEKLSVELMRYGSAYISVDMMHYNGEYKIIEINTNSVGRNIAWKRFGDAYLENYPKGLMRLVDALPDLPRLGALRHLRNQKSRILPSANLSL